MDMQAETCFDFQRNFIIAKYKAIAEDHLKRYQSRTKPNKAKTKGKRAKKQKRKWKDFPLRNKARAARTHGEEAIKRIHRRIVELADKQIKTKINGIS